MTRNPPRRGIPAAAVLAGGIHDIGPGPADVSAADGHRTSTRHRYTLMCECGHVVRTDEQLRNHRAMPAPRVVAYGPLHRDVVRRATLDAALLYSMRSEVPPAELDDVLAMTEPVDTRSREDLLAKIAQLEATVDQQRSAAVERLEQIGSLREQLYREQMLRQQAEFDLSDAESAIGALRLRVAKAADVAETGYAWATAQLEHLDFAKGRHRAAIEAYFDASPAVEAYAPATEQESAELAAPFGDPFDPRDLVREDDAAQLDHAGANPIGAVL